MSNVKGNNSNNSAAELAALRAQVEQQEKELNALRGRTARGGGGVKGAIRQLFASATRVSVVDVYATGTEVSVRTALSDLRNPKYASGPVLHLRKDGDFFVNDTAAVAAAQAALDATRALLAKAEAAAA